MTDIIEAAQEISDVSKTDLRIKLSQLESEMKKLPQLEIKVTHHFSKGVYAREIFVPKGSVFVGKIHKHQNLNIMSSGRGSIISIDGAMLIRAPYTIVSSPGVKRAYYAHEDTVWTTIHGTDETDIEKIEEMFIAKNYEEVVMLCDRSKSLIKGVE